MDKKLYYQLSDGFDVSNITMDLDGCMEWIKNDMAEKKETDADEIEYTITPIWLTDAEYENLPEADI